jgi:hypothetical protein
MYILFTLISALRHGNASGNAPALPIASLERQLLPTLDGNDANGAHG